MPLKDGSNYYRQMETMTRLQTATALTLALLLPAQAAEITASGTKDRTGNIIKITGILELEDGEKFKKVTRKLIKHNALVILDSPGGNVVGGLTIAYAIKAKGWSTGVVGGIVCASACADIWLAGKYRLLNSTSKIGMHSAGREVNGQMVRTAEANTLRAAYYLSIGLKAPAIITMLTPDPDDMMWLDKKNATQLGIVYTIGD